MSSEAQPPEVAVLCRTIAAALNCRYDDGSEGKNGDGGGAGGDGGGGGGMMAKFLAMRAKMDVTRHARFEPLALS